MSATRRSTGAPAMPITVRRAPPARQPGSQRSRLVHEAKLAEHAEVIEPTPTLDDATVADPEDLDPAECDRAAGGRHAHDLAALRAASGELLDDQVVLADEETDVAVPIGERSTEYGAGPAHTLAARGRPERRVVV